MDLSHKEDFNIATALMLIGIVTVGSVGLRVSKRIYRRLRPAK